jgi:hypothetical protein
MIRRFISATLAATLAVGFSPLALAQQGTISGKATGEAKKPYTDYNVQLVDTGTRQLTATVSLDNNGQFAFSGVPGDKQYLVQLFNLKENKIVCTEGPYALIAPDRLSRTDVNINCGKPAALWLLAAAAGLATTAAVVTQSGSQ